MSREEKQLAFINRHLDKFIKVALQNESKTGYMQCFVTTQFELQAAPVFVEGEFYKEGYDMLDSLKIKNPEGKKIRTVYLRILWSDNKTVWEVAQEVEIFTIPPAGVPNSENLN